MRIPQASIAGLVLMLLLLPACTPSVPDDNRAPTLSALVQMQGWLANARPIDATAFGFHCLDAWNWFMFSAWHPDASVRATAAAAADARLRAVRAPSEWTAVTLSYWALALRLMAQRGLPMDTHLAQVADVDVASALAKTTPTTRWWTLALLRQAGASVDDPDSTDTFLAEQVASRGSGKPILLPHVYRVYHEIASAAGLGLAPLTGFTGTQLEVALEIVPPTIEFSVSAGDTDALAEALTAGAILDLRDTEAYRTGIRSLLAKQNPDGTFRSNRDAHRRALTTDHYRHVMVVATFALLTSLAEYEPAEQHPTTGG